MERIEIAPEVLDDFARFLGHLEQYEVEHPDGRMQAIVAAPDILTHSPLIGRPVRGGERDPVIGRASHGCVALYRDRASIDTVCVLAMRNQREGDYKRPY